jgi:prophage regulatory protein
MSKILKRLEVQEMTGLSDTTLRRYERQGQFPKRRKLGERGVGWLESDVLEWIQKIFRPLNKNSMEVKNESE